MWTIGRGENPKMLRTFLTNGPLGEAGNHALKQSGITRKSTALGAARTAILPSLLHCLETIR